MITRSSASKVFTSCAWLSFVAAFAAWGMEGSWWGVGILAGATVVGAASALALVRES